MEIRVDKFISSLGNGVESILGFVLAVVFAVAAFFAPAKLNFYAVGTLVVMDIFTAFVAAYMANKRSSETVIQALLTTWSGWTSKRAFDSVPKLLWYFFLIISSFILGSIFDSGIKGANLATGIIAFIELRSILENGDKAFGTNMLQLMANYINKFLPKK